MCCESIGTVGVKELVDSYKESESNVNIIIYSYEGGTPKKHKIESKSKIIYKIVYDPQRKLKLGEYSDSYYCTDFYGFSEVLYYLFNDNEDIEESEDILDLKETKRYFFLDEEIDN